MNIFSGIFTGLLTGLAYRIRGGGFVSFGGDTIPRLIWGFSLADAYVIQRDFSESIDVAFTLLLIVLSFVSMWVPHAYVQNMGRWAIPQKKWPSFYMPTLTQADWDSMSIFERTAYDFFSMMGVGFFRGLIVFSPFVALAGDHWLAALPHAALALTLITIGQALAYLLGFYVPITITSSLQARSATWCEFLNGVAWAIALMVL